MVQDNAKKAIICQRIEVVGNSLKQPRNHKLLTTVKKAPLENSTLLVLQIQKDEKIKH